MFSGKRFFNVYTSLKLHFTTKYDVLKYGGKGKFSKAKLDEKRYGLLFDQWGSRFQSEKKLGHFVIANLIYGEIDFPFKPYADAEKVYLKWIKIRDTITKSTEEDLIKIKEAMIVGGFDFQYMTEKTPKGNLPPLLQMALFNKINIETLILIHKEYTPIFDKWDNLLYNDPYVQDKVFMMAKYIPFVNYIPEKIQPLFNIIRGQSGKEQ